MPQVPYQPFSTAQPQFQGEKIAVNTPGAAFGENIGAALKQLGGTTEQVGGELFQRAMALQELTNETRARQAASDLSDKSAEMLADYKSIEGIAAKDALPKFNDSIDKLRKDQRDTLNNPMAQRMFDAEAFSFANRVKFAAAGHAGEQFKNGVVGTAVAQADIISRTTIDPTSNSETHDKVQNSEEISHTLAGSKGWSEPERQDWLLKQKEKIWANRIDEVAKTDPPKALGMIDAHKDELGSLYSQTIDRTRTSNRAVGTSVLADKIFSPDKSWAQMEAEAEKLAPKSAHDDPLFLPDLMHTLRGRVSTDRFATAQDNRTAENKLWGGVIGGAKDMQTLLANPEMQAAYDSLPDSQKHQWPGNISGYIAKRDQSVRDDTYIRLRGMATGDVEQFLNANLGDYKAKGLIDQGQLKDLVSRRERLVQNPHGDPRIYAAIRDMRASHGAELQALGIYERKGNEDQYDSYVGGLESAVDEWTQAKGHPPNYKELTDEIGPQVIRQRHEPGMFGVYGYGVFGKNRPFFDQDVPDEVSNELNKQATDKGINLTPEEIKRAYVREQFKKLYSKPSGATSGQP